MEKYFKALHLFKNSNSNKKEKTKTSNRLATYPQLQRHYQKSLGPGSINQTRRQYVLEQSLDFFVMLFCLLCFYPQFLCLQKLIILLQ